MTPARRLVLAMAGYLAGLLLLFGAAFVFLTGVGDSEPPDASSPPATEQLPTWQPPAFLVSP